MRALGLLPQIGLLRPGAPPAAKYDDGPPSAHPPAFDLRCLRTDCRSAVVVSPLRQRTLRYVAGRVKRCLEHHGSSSFSSHLSSATGPPRPSRRANCDGPKGGVHGIAACQECSYPLEAVVVACAQANRTRTALRSRIGRCRKAGLTRWRPGSRPRDRGSGLNGVYARVVRGLWPPLRSRGFRGFMRLRATRRNLPRHLINARNEGVRGSSPRVGFTPGLDHSHPPGRTDTSASTCERSGGDSAHTTSNTPSPTAAKLVRESGGRSAARQREDLLDRRCSEKMRCAFRRQCAGERLDQVPRLVVRHAGRVVVAH